MMSRQLWPFSCEILHLIYHVRRGDETERKRLMVMKKFCVSFYRVFDQSWKEFPWGGLRCGGSLLFKMQNEQSLRQSVYLIHLLPSRVHLHDRTNCTSLFSVNRTCCGFPARDVFWQYNPPFLTPTQSFINHTWIFIIRAFFFLSGNIDTCGKEKRFPWFIAVSEMEIN